MLLISGLTYFILNCCLQSIGNGPTSSTSKATFTCVVDGDSKISDRKVTAQNGKRSLLGATKNGQRNRVAVYLLQAVNGKRRVHFRQTSRSTVCSVSTMKSSGQHCICT
jgi:hypothetical protein